MLILALSVPPWRSSYFPEVELQGHNKQLYGHWLEINSHQAIHNRSISGLIDVYNGLPQQAVDASSVSVFQSYLMRVTRTRCQQGNADWAMSFCRRAGPESSSTLDERE